MCENDAIILVSTVLHDATLTTRSLLFRRRRRSRHFFYFTNGL